MNQICKISVRIISIARQIALANLQNELLDCCCYRITWCIFLVVCCSSSIVILSLIFLWYGCHGCESYFNFLKAVPMFDDCCVRESQDGVLRMLMLWWYAYDVISLSNHTPFISSSVYLFVCHNICLLIKNESEALKNAYLGVGLKILVPGRNPTPSRILPFRTMIDIEFEISKC
jgi:hypothetical protein